MCDLPPLACGSSDSVAGDNDGQISHGPQLTALGKVSAGTATVRGHGDIESVLDVLGSALRRTSFSNQEMQEVRAALHAALDNAVRHGHRGDSARQVHIRYLINHAGLLAQVEDKGVGFRPEHAVVGRGLALMRQHMTEVRFNAVGNCVTLIKRRQPASITS
jgi:anti-sigma regulatory factor (Ser/Thr protein kinase)